MINISLLDFFRTGHFGAIALGMTRQEILNLMGEPDDFGYPPTHYHQAGVWKYGDIEFHFGEDLPRLFLIWCDLLPFADNKSRNISLDAWLFGDGKQPSKQDIERGLKAANITYKYIEFEQKIPGELTLFVNEEEAYERESVEDEASIRYQSAEGTGTFILESGVEIGIGEISEHYRRDRPSKIREGLAITIGFQNLDYYEIEK
jgi:hypothetical protein